MNKKKKKYTSEYNIRMNKICEWENTVYDKGINTNKNAKKLQIDTE